MNSQTKTEYHPDYVSPPGETLQETLDMHGLSQAELAERTGRPKKTINEIIQGKAAITPDTALQLELVLRVPATFWLAREAKYRAWLARKDEDARLDKDIDFLQKLPIKEMVSHGWIEKSKGKRELARSVLQFFGVVSSDKIPLVEQAAFRRSETFTTNAWALAAWLRKGALEARSVSVCDYNREKFAAALTKIRKVTPDKPAVFVPRITQLCANAGVTVVFVPELPGTLVSGAMRWLTHNRPLIQLSLRYKTDDMFWFSFFHACGHVFNEHAKREVLLENQLQNTLDQRELVANQFAMDLLIPQPALDRFIEKRSFTQDAIRRFGKDLGIAPGIVVGRLQHDGHLDLNNGKALTKTFAWEQWPSH